MDLLCQLFSCFGHALRINLKVPRNYVNFWLLMLNKFLENTCGDWVKLSSMLIEAVLPPSWHRSKHGWGWLEARAADAHVWMSWAGHLMKTFFFMLVIERGFLQNIDFSVWIISSTSLHFHLLHLRIWDAYRLMNVYLWVLWYLYIMREHCTLVDLSWKMKFSIYFELF